MNDVSEKLPSAPAPFDVVIEINAVEAQAGYVTAIRSNYLIAGNDNIGGGASGGVILKNDGRSLRKVVIDDFIVDDLIVFALRQHTLWEWFLLVG